MSRVQLTLVAGVVAALLGGACSLGHKQALADRIIAAGKRAEAAGPTRATLSVRAQRIKTRLPVAPGPPRIVSAAAAGLPVVIDARSNRAALAFAGEDPTTAVMVFAGNTVFQRRTVQLPEATKAAAATAPTNLIPLAATGSKGGGVLPTAPVTATTTSTTVPAAGASRLHRSTKIERTWLAFDYASIPKRNTDKAAGSFAISPVEIERLLEGTLTGSVKTVEPGHYKINLSRDKAERHLSDGVRKDLDKTFKANAIGGRVFPAEVWVDPAGNLQKISVRFRQALSDLDKDDLTVTIDFAAAAPPAAVPVPDPKATATVQNLTQLVRGAFGA